MAIKKFNSPDGKPVQPASTSTSKFSPFADAKASRLRDEKDAHGQVLWSAENDNTMRKYSDAEVEAFYRKYEEAGLLTDEKLALETMKRWVKLYRNMAKNQDDTSFKHAFAAFIDDIIETTGCDDDGLAGIVALVSNVSYFMSSIGR